MAMRSVVMSPRMFRCVTSTHAAAHVKPLTVLESQSHALPHPRKFAVRADRDPAVNDMDRALYLTIDVEIFAAPNLAFNH